MPKLFGTAANNGQMIGEVESDGKTSEIMTELARSVTGRMEARKGPQGAVRTPDGSLRSQEGVVIGSMMPKSRHRFLGDIIVDLR